MEALLEREADMESWNDERLDELNQTMKEGFARVDRQLEKTDRETDRRFNEVKHSLHRVHDQLDRFVYAQVFFAISITAAVLANGIWG